MSGAFVLTYAATQHHANDDFSWDDDPEETDPDTKIVPNAQSVEDTPLRPANTVQEGQSTPHKVVSTSTSPRDSEESYDVVSDQGPKTVKPVPQGGDDDEDSDWE
jgi:hypothetical protein